MSRSRPLHPSDERGFTVLELICAGILLALIVVVALPQYLGARNKAALAEAQAAGQEWAALLYSCYEQNAFPGVAPTNTCYNSNTIGFQEPNGKYWQFNQTFSPTTPWPINVSGTANNSYASVTFPSLNQGYYNNEKYAVTVYLTGVTKGQTTWTCLNLANNPVQC